MVFHWSLSDSKSPQVSILADLNDAVWMVSTHPLISKSSSLCINPLVTVPTIPINITITFMFHSFFRFFTLRSTKMAKSAIQQVLFFFWSGRLIKIRLSICIFTSITSHKVNTNIFYCVKLFIVLSVCYHIKNFNTSSSKLMYDKNTYD